MRRCVLHARLQMLRRDWDGDLAHGGRHCRSRASVRRRSSVLPQNIGDEEAIAAGRAAFVAAAATNRFDGYEIWDLERKVYESKESGAQVDK
jgi:hypothetical protein